MLLSEARQGTLLLRYVRKDGWNLADDNNTRLCSRKMGWLVWFSRLKMSYRRKLGTFWYFFFRTRALSITILVQFQHRIVAKMVDEIRG